MKDVTLSFGNADGWFDDENRVVQVPETAHQVELDTDGSVWARDKDAPGAVCVETEGFLPENHRPKEREILVIKEED